jgi:quinol monooxygenase YgiN
MTRKNMILRVIVICGLISCGLVSAVGALEPADGDLHPLSLQVKGQLADAKQPFTLALKLTVNPGQERPAIGKMMEFMGKARKEDGCLRYEISRVAGKQNEFLIYERWQSLADLDRHLKQDYMVKAVEEFTNWAAREPEIIVAVPLEPEG